MDPKWLTRARAFVGLKEVPGKATAPLISKWLVMLKAWWRDDETPWCGVFVAAVMRLEGFDPPPAWYRARAWLDWGSTIREPALGCIAIFARGGAGHVGFVVGNDEAGRLMVLGGNQGNAVSIAPFDRSRVLGYRWPTTNIAPGGPLPLVASRGAKPSINEA
jgi:uncharacterized protein (TIGR02594 family)